ncbi:MAG: DUF4352 domain-containing protein [Coriobacteriia bacterium]|nr:DUF4352 domain-containing protein [Coriobacteriia bacterium]
MLRRFIVVVVLICCLALAAGCVVVQPKPDGTWGVSLFPPSSQTTVTGGSSVGAGGGPTASQAKAATGHPAYPGTAQKSGPWTVMVEDANSPKELQDGSKPASGKRFMVLDVAVRNSGTGAALNVLPNQFALWDSRNKVVDPYPAKLDMYNALSVKPIDVGMGGFTSFVYEIPTSPAVYTFTITPKQGATSPMSWYVP